MQFVVENAEQARASVEFFNAFYDGFIRRFSLVSHDRFEDRDTHVTTGELDLEIVFAHCNYREGNAPCDQLVEARFSLVRDLRIAFTGEATDWPIMSFEIDAEGTRLRARMIQPRLVDNSRWEYVEAMAFSFQSAVFCELPADGA